MTAANVLYLLLIFAALFALRESFVQTVRCRYCGKVNTHEEHCPYAGL